MRLRCVLLLSLVAAVPAAAFDHTDPVALRAAAIEALRAADTKRAEILLARAARLAPDDARIAQARKALEALRAGESVTLEAPPVKESKPAQGKAAPAAVPPEPPPLWPAR